MDNALLVNIVHNDFHDQNKIFEPFFKLEESTVVQNGQAVVANGHVANGHAN
jgi:hypothetical protein